MTNIIKSVFGLYTLMVAGNYALIALLYWRTKKANVYSWLFWSFMGVLSAWCVYKNHYWTLAATQCLYGMASFKVAAANASSVRAPEQGVSFVFSGLMIASIVSVLYYCLMALAA